MGWSAWVPIGSPPSGSTGRPAALSRNSRVTNIYARGGDKALWQLGFWNNRWHGWDRHEDGLMLASSPAAASPGPDHEIVFAAGADGALRSKSWRSGTGWSGWDSLGTNEIGFTGDPVATCRDPRTCNVYVRGTDNALWQLIWSQDGRRHWARHGDAGMLAADPAAAALGPDQEIVFIVGTDGDVWAKRWTAGAGWGGWDLLGAPVGGVAGGLGAISRHPGVVDIFARGNDDALWQRGYRDGRWHDWTRHQDGTAVTGTPVADARGPNHELVVHRGRDAELYLKWWEPNLPSVDVNLIRVGVDEPAGLPQARWICFQAGFDARTVNHFRIGSGQAGALEIVDSLADAEELSDRWSAGNGALDVFLVRSMNVAGGWSAVGGRAGEDHAGTLNGILDAGRNPIVYGWQEDPKRGTLSPATFGPAAFGDLRAVAGGTTRPEHRVRAMTLLALADPEYGGRLFRAALQDDSADVTVRASAATWLSRFAADAQPALLAALDIERSALVRHKIIAGLARVGEEEVLPVLSDLARSDPSFAVHACFAQSVIAHREGVSGYEPATAEELPLAPAPHGARPINILETHEAIPDASHLPADTYGLIVGPGVASLRCGGRRLAVAIDLTALAQLLTTPTIAGLVATAEATGSLHTAMLVLCWPATDNTAHLALHRPHGTPVFAGSAKVTGTSVSFHLTAVQTPGARHATLAGTIVSGILEELNLTPGPPLPPQTPEPI